MRCGSAIVAVLLAGACHGGTSPTTPDASLADAASADVPVDAPPSSFSFVPTSLDFGYVPPGTNSAPMPLAVVNNTSADIPDFSLVLSGDDTIELITTQTTCTSTLSVDGCTLELSFQPRSVGDHMMEITAMAPSQISATASIHASGGTPPPGFGTAASYLDFGTVIVGNSYGQVVTYENSGTTTLPPVSFMFAGESPDQYHLEDDHCTGLQLAPRGTCTVVVVYTPTAWMTPGAAILYGTADNTSELDLRAVAGAATSLSVSPPSYDFGSVGPAASANIPFTITNTGTVAATGFADTINNSQFSVTSTTCTTLAPGDTCVMNVQLAPTATGPDDGGMTVYGTNASNAKTDFEAIAIPAEGVILDTWSHDFGTVEAGTIGTNYTFTVTNVGTTATPIALSLDDDPTAFAIAQDNCSATSLAAGDTCTFEIEFTPMIGGTHFGRVHATSASNDAIADLTGTATPGDMPLAIDPADYNYTTIAIGVIASQGFLVTNEGGVAKVPTMSLTGSDADEFVMMNDTCTGTSLGSGASCTIDVWYIPASVGTKSAGLQATWATGSTTATLEAGAFEDSNAFVTSDPPTYDFGAVTVGNSASFTLPFTNHGAATSPAMAFLISGINYMEFSLTSDNCTGVVLANGDTCTVSVVFTPMSTGTKHGELVVTVGDGFTAFLTGTGE